MGVNRITGLNSGMDTEALVTSLVSSYQKKVDTLQGNQKRHAWKQDAWKALNKKTVSFYNGKLNTMSFQSAFTKKTTTSTNEKAVSIMTGENAMNATQRIKVKAIASSAYATGKEIKDKNGNRATGSTKLADLREGLTPDSTYTEKELLFDDELVYEKLEDGSYDTSRPVYKKDAEGNILKDENDNPIQETIKVPRYETDANGDIKLDEKGNKIQASREVTKPGFSFTVKVGEGEPQTLVFGADATINDVVSKLKSLNVNGQKFNANFDAGQGRMYMASATTGAAGSFQFGGNEALLGALGLDTTAHKGEDAEILLNGESYTSNSGTFEINGLTITANEVTSEEFTITTKSDTSGIYDMVKDLFKEYNELIKELDTNYYSDPAKKYQMLSDEEKEAMSDKEVEEWEKHIKEGLLSKDGTLYDVIQGLKGVMQGGIEVNGETLYLSHFGINTGSYLTTDQNERGVYHIDGDTTDMVSGANTDKLKSMISTDPDKVATFFSKLAQNMRSKLFDMMKTTDYSSSFTIYEDKLMASQYSDYNTKIADATERLNKKQDAYYARFTRMEKAMAKTNAVQSSLSGYFG